MNPAQTDPAEAEHDDTQAGSPVDMNSPSDTSAEAAPEATSNPLEPNGGKEATESGSGREGQPTNAELAPPSKPGLPPAAVGGPPPEAGVPVPSMYFKLDPEQGLPDAENQDRLDHLAVPDTDGMPAGRHEPAEMALLGGFRVNMEVLRIVKRAEAHDLLGREGVRTEREAVADGDVLEPAGHGPWRPCSLVTS